MVAGSLKLNIFFVAPFHFCKDVESPPPPRRLPKYMDCLPLLQELFTIAYILFTYFTLSAFLYSCCGVGLHCISKGIVWPIPSLKQVSMTWG